MRTRSKGEPPNVNWNISSSGPGLSAGLRHKKKERRKKVKSPILIRNVDTIAKYLFTVIFWNERVVITFISFRATRESLYPQN